MKKDILRFVAVLFTIGILLGIGFALSSKKSYVETPFDFALDNQIKNTTWELVQYSDGREIENLVGTDWVMHFDADRGFIRLCDTHPFSYTLSGGRITFTFSETASSSCQDSTLSSESVFFDLLNQSPLVERVSYETKEFNEVLTLVSGNKKMVFIPRVDMPAGSLSPLSVLNNKEKSVSIKAEYSCTVENTEEQVPCSAPFQGEFVLTQLDATPDKKPYTSSVLTDATGISVLMVPFGTYQVTLLKTPTLIENQKYDLNPIIFSIVSTTGEPYELLLTLDRAI